MSVRKLPKVQSLTSAFEVSTAAVLLSEGVYHPSSPPFSRIFSVLAAPGHSCFNSVPRCVGLTNEPGSYET